MAATPSLSSILKSPLSIASLLTIMTFTAATASYSGEKEASFHFYMQERISPPNATGVKLVSSPINPAAPIFAFGNVIVFDNPLTADAVPSSPELGRAQGVAAFSSLDGRDILYALTLTFTEHGPHPGSSIVILARNPTKDFWAVRELPVVGGTGKFRLARGYVLMKIVYFNESAGVLRMKMDVFLQN
ncbi:Disease resistance response protein 206 [Apostasia shenzhenica]|uniref:Dirigent protein n=1 Tax=Apostasia shenzhenica TaxID=1088818 RepID=A0A2I0AB49_9ASPA|nr:Disease resistance response protein 206 [Apostasia shenzhenica]